MLLQLLHGASENPPLSTTGTNYRPSTKNEYVPDSCYRIILTSCSYYLEQIMLKMAKLEFENHKKTNISRGDHVKTNIFGKRMTKLTC